MPCVQYPPQSAVLVYTVRENYGISTSQQLAINSQYSIIINYHLDDVKTAAAVSSVLKSLALLTGKQKI